MDAIQLNQQLNQFTGTMEYTVYNRLLLLTEGVVFLAKNAGGGCFWLIDCIYSYLSTDAKLREKQFMYATLRVKDNQARFYIDDSDGNRLVTQDIEYTDFPLNKITLYVGLYGKQHIVCLPSED